MTYVQESKLTADIVTLSQVKNYMRIDFDDDDTLITTIISSAITLAEKYMNRDLLTTTWVRYIPSFVDDLTLRRGKFQSVDSVEYLKDGVYVVVPAEKYNVKVGGVFGVICSIENQNHDHNCNAVKITFKSGFGDTGEDIPSDIKIAIQSIASWLYESKGDCSKSMLPMLAQSILKQYRIIDIVGEPHFDPV
jgi:uncharacterized phiE125 gp8 family phage protein